MCRRSLLVAFLTLLCAPLLRADLVWEKPWQTFQRLAGDDALETSFAFKNTGDHPVTIRHVKTSCGCTTAKLAKYTFAPGEGGGIAVKFTLGGRKGPQRKMITVTTDDQTTPTELNLVVRIQEPLVISPALVFWKVGAPNEPKSVQLTAGEGSRVQVKSVTSSNPQITARLETIKPGEQYAITVAPADTAQKASAEITVETDFPADQPRSYTLHARIK